MGRMWSTLSRVQMLAVVGVTVLFCITAIYAFWPWSGVILYLSIAAAICATVGKKAGWKAAGWTAAVALGLLAGIACFSREKPGPLVVAQVSAATTSAVPSTVTPSVQKLKLTPKADSPAKLSVPPGWRWDMKKPIPTDWTTDGGARDENGNRIQVFEVVHPAQEVALEITLTKCTTPQMCAW